MAEEMRESATNTVELATQVTVAWLANPNVRASAEEVPAFLKTIHATLGELSNTGTEAAAEPSPDYVPAVPVRSSVKPDHLVSLIDGRKFKTLKRHLSLNGLTPAEYRERYGLKPDYPMVAANYSAQRGAIAKKLGLGRKGGRGRGKAAEAVPTSAVKKRGRAQ